MAGTWWVWLSNRHHGRLVWLLLQKIHLCWQLVLLLPGAFSFTWGVQEALLRLDCVHMMVYNECLHRETRQKPWCVLHTGFSATDVLDPAAILFCCTGWEEHKCTVVSLLCLILTEGPWV